jgi:zona occludens toxin
MINGLEGIPGSGKSYEACVHHVLPALQAGRLVITNLPLLVDMWAAINPDFLKLLELRRRVQPIRGTWDAERVDEKTGEGNAFELFADGHTEKPAAKVSLFGHVWDYYSEWKHPVTGQGPLFIIDECHVGMPTIGTDPEVIEWYKLHRHFNADVLLGTQSFRDMNQPIARLMAMLVKVRKADILGRADHYIRKVHGGYRGAVISTEERKYRPEFFNLYKSHTQGNSVAEALAQDVSPFIVKFKRYTRNVWVLFGIGALALGYYYYSKWSTAKPITTVSRTVGPPAGYVAPMPRWMASSPATSSQSDTSQPMAVDEIPEPYQNKGLHLNGFLTVAGQTMYMLSVSQNGVVVSHVTSKELVRAGYRYIPLSDCAGVVQWMRNNRAVTCDTPQIGIGGGGSASQPKT